MRLNKGFLILCALSFCTGILIGTAYVAASDNEQYEAVKDIEVLTVVDWPPVSEKSIFYTGQNRTSPAQRSIFGLINPSGTSITDTELNRYLVSGSVGAHAKSYVLKKNSRGNMRLCSDEECFSVTRKIEHLAHSSAL